jgi:Uma2 family endonuclease
MPATLIKPTKERRTKIDNVAELVFQLGSVPLSRILLHPPPGKATEANLLRLLDREPKRLCELIDGTLVEKSVGIRKSNIGVTIGAHILNYLNDNDLGFATDAGGPYRLKTNHVRLPDVAFIAWSRFPSRDAALECSIAPVSPNLAVEILSESNTKKEMTRKVEQYLASCVELIWIVDPKKRLVTVHRPDAEPETLTPKDKLKGDKVLPGFKLEISKFL